MKILTVVALGDETQGLFCNENVLYTGVGKVNSTYTLTREIVKLRPDLIVNLGTAGSKIFGYGELVLCQKFVQKDMDVTAIGYEKFVTPMESDAILEYPCSIAEKLGIKTSGILGTGDSFDINVTGNEVYNIVDMEGYGLAKVAKNEGIPFICVKFVSDGADDMAPKSWDESLVLCAKKLRDIYDVIISVI